jgi:hypothetical protein
VTKSNPGESSKFVLAAARAAGFQVSEDQLSGWHRDGLIPRPKQSWTEGIAGSQTIYPPGASDQLCALCTIQKENRSSVNWGWKLWWLGFPVDDRYWRMKLKAHALLHDKSSREFIHVLGNNQDDDLYEIAVTTWRTGRTRNVPFRQLRRRLVAGHFEGMLGLVLQILECGFRGWSFASSDDTDALRERMMIERVFGFRRASNTHEMVCDPTMHDDIEDALHLLSDQLGETKIASVLKVSPDSRIAEARMQLRVILFAVSGTDGNSSLLGRYGGPVLKALAQRMTPGDQAVFLLYLLALKRNPMFQKNLAVFLHALRRHVPKTISKGQVEYLRSRDPAICSFAFPD